jgi:hypothetical protein
LSHKADLGAFLVQWYFEQAIYKTLLSFNSMKQLSSTAFHWIKYRRELVNPVFLMGLALA